MVAANNTIYNNILIDMSTIVYRIAADSTGGLVSNYNIVPSGARFSPRTTVRMSHSASGKARLAGIRTP